MKSRYFIALLLTLSISGVYWYKSTASECPVPLSYRLGEIDESFSISEFEALSYIKEAELIWEDVVNRQLFVYDESSDFVIDFVFDERQASANSEAEQREILDVQKEKNESVLRTVETLQAEYQVLSDGYKKRADAYEANLTEYNTEVSNYNDHGGAPPDVYEELGTKKDSLNEESTALSRMVVELNDLAEEINLLGERGSELVDSYNREVNDYNSEFGFAREFTQGDYQKEKISIYKFSSGTELVNVLAHEFGHALGIDHVEGSSSLMYYLLEDTHESPVLSGNDILAYQSVCGMTETFEQKIRRVIRELLTKI